MTGSHIGCQSFVTVVGSYRRCSRKNRHDASVGAEYRFVASRRHICLPSERKWRRYSPSESESEILITRRLACKCAPADDVGFGIDFMPSGGEPRDRYALDAIPLGVSVSPFRFVEYLFNGRPRNGTKQPCRNAGRTRRPDSAIAEEAKMN